MGLNGGDEGERQIERHVPSAPCSGEFQAAVRELSWVHSDGFNKRATREEPHGACRRWAAAFPDRKSTRLNSSHITRSRMPSSA